MKKRAMILAAAAWLAFPVAAAPSVSVEGLVVASTASGAAEINRTLAQAAQEICTTGGDFFTNAAHDEWAGERYRLEYRQEITYEDEDFLSVTASLWQYTGGAHGITETTAWVFDKKTGRPLTLAAFTGAASRADINASVRETARQSLAAQGVTYWEDSLAAETAAERELSFYLDKNGAVTVFFNPYEVAPYSSGTVTVTLPAGA